MPMVVLVVAPMLALTAVLTVVPAVLTTVQTARTVVSAVLTVAPPYWWSGEVTGRQTVVAPAFAWSSVALRTAPVDFLPCRSRRSSQLAKLVSAKLIAM
ncbi:hypothetical protein SUDANB145_01884 [Streptomyces sp. enrichment culture]